MKQAFLLFAAFFAVIVAQAQTNSWKIKMNKKIVLATSVENEKSNVRKIKKDDLKKTGFLEILFTEAEPDTWYRSFQLYDKDDHELLRMDSTTDAKIAFTQLRQLYRNRKEIIIYTTVTPRDPNLAVRVRRVHLCTLQIK
jgi:hypothetical protein